jgi:hypothetical protein
MQCKLWEQFKHSRNGNCPWSTKTFVRTVCEIEHHDIVCSGVFANEFSDKLLQVKTGGAFNAWKEATEEYMIDIVTVTHPLLSNIVTDL